MPRVYVRKKQSLYQPDELKKVLQLIRDEQISVKEASKQYHISVPTLYSRLSGIRGDGKPGVKSILTKEEEKFLIHVIHIFQFWTIFSMYIMSSFLLYHLHDQFSTTKLVLSMRILLVKCSSSADTTSTMLVNLINYMSYSRKIVSFNIFFVDSCCNKHSLSFKYNKDSEVIFNQSHRSFSRES